MKKEPPIVRQTGKPVVSIAFTRVRASIALGLTVDDSSSLRQVLRADLDLSVLQGDLSRESDCEAYDDLEPNPFPGACRFVHGVEEAAAYRAERAADEPEERHDADFRESKALRDSGEGEWDDQGQHADTRADRVRVVDGLKVERQVVQDDEVGA